MVVGIASFSWSQWGSFLDIRNLVTLEMTEDKAVAVSAKGVKYESSHEMEDLTEDGVVASTVPSKYRGTITDKEDMRTLGKNTGFAGTWWDVSHALWI